jgi:hypothetical protein
MKTATTLALGALMLVSITAFSLNDRPAPHAGTAFSASIRGEVNAQPNGEARFGIVAGGPAAPAVFTISLGAEGQSGSILFTRRSGARLSPGIYTISDRADGSDDVRALVVTGSATKPTGVFRGHSGLLVITVANDSLIRGTFKVEAAGFLADAPELEGRPVTASGAFTAQAR